MKDTSFNDSITTAEQKGMRTAWSNEDFELWILLHFSLMNNKSNSAIERAEILERFHNLSSKPTHMHCPCTKVHNLVKELLQ